MNVIEGFGGTLLTASTETGTQLYNQIVSYFGGASAAGDIVIASALNTLDRLAKGSANQKLFMNAAGTLPEWGSPIYTGYTTRDSAVATGTQAVTGVGFKPSIVIAFSSVVNTSEVSIGSDMGSGVNGCVYNNASNVLGKWGPVSHLVQMQEDASKAYYCDISAMDADGFTLSWTRVDDPTGTIEIYYLAIR